MKFPLIRVLLTVFLIGGWVLFDYTYETYKGPIEGQAAVVQLNDSDVEYGAARRVIVDEAIVKGVNYGVTGK